MRCPKCDAQIGEDTRQCSFCGQDLSVIHYVKRVSNAYYNMGLERAHVRDLSGAVVILKKSLQFNKANTNARNLLGLVYYEMGEMVAALSEWVLSKYLQPEDNAADHYINTVEKNQTALDAANQTIKKYNAALAAAKGGNEDLAMIQLKKVVSLNPHFIRAQQLLALLYIHAKEYQKAMKCLNRAEKIDCSNTVTLRYMQEIKDKAGSSPKSTATIKKAPKKDPLANVTPVGTYHEEKKSLMPFVQVLVGIIIGIAVCFFLIRPTLQKNSRDGGTDIADTNEQLSVQSSQISTLKREKATLEKQVKELNKEIKEGNSEALKKAESYEKLLKGLKYYLADDKIQAAVAVADCKKSEFAIAEAKSLYTTIGHISEEQIRELLNDGIERMASPYTQSIQIFRQVLSVDKQNQDAMYYLGRCYQRLGRNEVAKKWYTKAIKADDTSSVASQAERGLREVKAAMRTGGNNNG